MPSSKTLELRFPAAGVVRRLGFRDSLDVESPYPAPWAVNVRPEDPLAHRLRGGSRPGLTAFDPDDLDATDYQGDEKILANLASIPADTYVVARGALLYAINDTVTMIDVATGATAALSATLGTIPADCTFGAVYRDRLLLAGADNAIYQSRQGKFSDWKFSVDVGDVGRPSFFQLSEAGEIGGVTTALVPYRDTFLLAATGDSLWSVHGDLVSSGTLRNVSRTVGIVSSRAWEKVGNSVFFLAKDGLYSVGADGGNLIPLSRAIPAELLDVDPTAVTVLLGHDSRENGVHLYLTPATGLGTHWYFDLDRKGFWPISLSATHQPTALYDVRGKLVLGNSTTALWSVEGDDDDGTAIESHLVIGPLRPGSSAEFGMLTSLFSALGEDSGTVTWRIVAGETAEEACENAKTAIGLFQAGDTAGAAEYVSGSGAFSAGRSHAAYPRTRAMWFVIWLQSTAKWAFEGITVEMKTFGRWR